MPIRYHNLRSESVLRGGNLRKVGKTILTRAPALALTPVLALGALLCLDTASRAGECIEQTGTPAHYVCSGIANGLFDTTRRLEAGSGEQLFVRQIVSSSPFGIDVTDGNALELYGSPDSTGINVDLMPVIVTEGENAGAGFFSSIKGPAMSISPPPIGLSQHKVKAFELSPGRHPETWTSASAEGLVSPTFLSTETESTHCIKEPENST